MWRQAPTVRSSVGLMSLHANQSGAGPRGTSGAPDTAWATDARWLCGAHVDAAWCTDRTPTVHPRYTHGTPNVHHRNGCNLGQPSVPQVGLPERAHHPTDVCRNNRENRGHDRRMLTVNRHCTWGQHIVGTILTSAVRRPFSCVPQQTRREHRKVVRLTAVLLRGVRSTIGRCKSRSNQWRWLGGVGAK